MCVFVFFIVSVVLLAHDVRYNSLHVGFIATTTHVHFITIYCGLLKVPGILLLEN